MLKLSDKLFFIQYMQDYLNKDIDEYEICFEYDISNKFFEDYTLEQYIRKCKELYKWVSIAFPELYFTFKSMENNSFSITFTKHTN